MGDGPYLRINRPAGSVKTGSLSVFSHYEEFKDSSTFIIHVTEVPNITVTYESFIYKSMEI